MMERQVRCCDCQHVRDFADDGQYTGGLKWCQALTNQRLDQSPEIAMAAEIVNPMQLRTCRYYERLPVSV